MSGFTTDGVIFKIEDTTPGTFVALPQQMMVSPPQFKRKKTEIPVAGQDFPIQIFGKREAQECKVKFLFDPDIALHTDFFTRFGSRATKKYRIEFPDPTPRTETFDAVVIGWEPEDMDADGKPLAVNCTLALTTDVTVA